MSCTCGSPICDCRAECLCEQHKCPCNKCSLLPKICSRCSLPFYIFVHQRANAGSICSCKARSHHLPSEFHLQSQNLATNNENIVTIYRRTQCPRCSLPIVIVTSEDHHSSDSCCCSRKNADSNTTGTPTEHETSNCTSDHREISEDRQARKTSRRTRTEKSIWQYKKTKSKHLTNPDENNSDTGTLTSEEFLFRDSRNIIVDNSTLNVPYTGSVTSDSNFQNLNFHSNTHSPTGFSFRAGNSSMGNVSLFANTSGLSSPSTSKDFISIPESPGFFRLSQNARPTLPPPFPVVPKPLPAFRNSGGRHSPQLIKPGSVHPSLHNQPALARAEKMEKWFETLESVITVSGELPDAEAAAILDKADKEKIKQHFEDHSDDQFESETLQNYIEPFRSSQNPCGILFFNSATNNQKSGKELDVTDPTTDTEKSSTLSKSRKESESD